MGIFTNGHRSLAMLVLMLGHYHHEREVLENLANQGRMAQEQIENMKKQHEAFDAIYANAQEGNWHQYDTSTNEVQGDGIRFEGAMSVDESGWEMNRIRGIRDMMNHGIEDFRGNPEVDAWLERLGGIKGLNEKLIGLSLGKGGWYKRTLARLKEETGFYPSPLGEATPILGVDSATSYSSYAVEAHRKAVNSKAHGERKENENSDFDWAQHSAVFVDANSASFKEELKLVPWWWKKAGLNRGILGWKKGQDKLSPKAEICHILSGKKDGVTKWRYNFFIGEKFGQAPYRPLSKVLTDLQMDVNSTVREFLHRFYNDPSRLAWGRVGGEQSVRWAAAMRTPKGQILWCQVSKAFNDELNYWTNDGANVVDSKIDFNGKPREKKAWVTYDKKALVRGHAWIRVAKVADSENSLRVNVYQTVETGYTMIEEHGPNGGLKLRPTMSEMLMKSKVMDSYTWGAKKKELLRKGWTEVVLKKGNFKPETGPVDVSI